MCHSVIMILLLRAVYLYFSFPILLYAIDENRNGPLATNCGNSTNIKCCNGYFLKGSVCEECPAGTFGINCTDACQDGYYGRRCRSKCDCHVTQRCDKIRGCVIVVRDCIGPECGNGTLNLFDGNNRESPEPQSHAAAVVVPILLVIILICIVAIWMKFHGYDRVTILREFKFWKPRVVSSMSPVHNDTTRCRANNSVIYDDIRESRMILDACTSSAIRKNNSDNDIRYQDIRFLKLKPADVAESSPYSKCDAEDAGTYCKLAHDGQKTKETPIYD